MGMILGMRTLPAGFIAPCLPTKTDKPPSGSQWLHEIKHDGFRVVARKVGANVRLYSRPGNDLTYRFPLIVESLARLRSRSCIIDGEAVACDDNGVASFDLVRHHRANERIFLYAFDLIELNGDDLRRDPLEVRKATLASIVAKASPGIRFNEHIEGDGPTIFAHACKLGLEGIVSKRKDSTYRSGRSPDWLKMKNSDAPAIVPIGSRPRARVRALWGLSGWRGNERIADSIKKGPPGARAGGGCCSGSDRAPNFQGSAGRERNPVRGLAQLASLWLIACPASKLRHTCSDHCCRMGADCRELDGPLRPTARLSAIGPFARSTRARQANRFAERPEFLRPVRAR